MAFLPMLAAYLHDLDPFLFELKIGGSSFGVRWYGLSYLVGFLAAFGIIWRITKVGRSPLKPEAVRDFVLSVALGVVAGGRIGYVLFYRPELFITFSEELPYWDLLALNKGGMASHGGMIGMLLATWLYGRWHRVPWGHLLDLTALTATLGVFFGRLANFVNGELFGRGPTDVAWAVKFPQEMYRWAGTEASEAQRAKLAELVRALAERGLIPQQLRETGTAYDLVSWTIQQIQGHHGEVRAVVEPLLVPRHPSQIYAAFLEGLVVFTVVAVVARRPRKPFLLTGLACTLYAAGRFFDEFYRLPDAHLMEQEFAVTGLSRGQWLSLPVFVLGLGLLWFAKQREAEPLGGWVAVDRGDADGSAESPGSEKPDPT